MLKYASTVLMRLHKQLVTGCRWEEVEEWGLQTGGSLTHLVSPVCVTYET